MTEEQLLQQLSKETFITLKPSNIAGIGVFAIAPIRKGQTGFFSNDNAAWIPISKEKIEALPPHSRWLVENFCLYDEENYFVPEYGFTKVDLVIYLNHSDHPNVRSLGDGADFEAIRDIEPGEELLIDYGEIVDD